MRLLRTAAALAATLLALAAAGPIARATAPTDDWTQYQLTNGKSGYNAAETTLTASNVGTLRTLWTASGNGSVAVQAAEHGGLVYWGSWNGYEHAYTTSGTKVWQTFLGLAHHSGCNPGTAGVSGTPAIGPSGTHTALFVGGGDAKVYALDAATGAILWSSVALGTLNEAFLYSSPVTANGSVYIGVASLADCPLVQGKLVKLNAATGAIQATLNVVPNGCLGGGIWGSPSIAPDGTLYVATGTWHTCPRGEPLSAALLKVDPANLAVLDHWQLPLASISTADIEFGSAPTVFDFTRNGVTYSRVAIGAKDGKFYAFNRAKLASGPVWTDHIDTGGTCPQCGDGVLSPSAWDGAHLFAAAGKTTVGGASCAGSVRSLDPLTGAYVWQHCLSGPVLGPVAEFPGVVMAAGGNHLYFLSASTGAQLHVFTDPSATAKIYAGPMVARGQVWIGDMSGGFFALGH